MKQSSFKLWEDKSPYDGSEIVAIITNLFSPSKNPKTGPMSQLWILPKNEVPWQAIKTEDGDDGVCGDCIYAPKRAKRAKANGHKIPSCYVARRGWQAPSSVWKAYINKPIQLKDGLKAIEQNNMPIRFGAYGDIGMLPSDLVDRIYSVINTHTAYTHTAYTHQYNRVWASWTKAYAMASVNNKYDGKLFRELNWRTFRVTERPEAGLNEIICPNYTHGTQCIDCGLCNGSYGPDDKRKSITIPAH
ncbi:hypothetical protein LCGC14_1490400 [marine sediment metagenome]|uniref:Uncharacterized protein n=1 Tax=marine sediment metagenome TaxID=412755 RepID=A0A0F9JSU4_9ZZZZ